MGIAAAWMAGAALSACDRGGASATPTAPYTPPATSAPGTTSSAARPTATIAADASIAALTSLAASTTPGTSPAKPATAVATAVAPPPPAPSAPTPTGGGQSITIVAADTKFVPSFASLPAGATLTLTFDNQDAGVAHDIEIFDPSSAEIAHTEIANGPDVQTITFTLGAPGRYSFKCVVHPTKMFGSFTVQ